MLASVVVNSVVLIASGVVETKSEGVVTLILRRLMSLLPPGVDVSGSVFSSETNNN